MCGLPCAHTSSACNTSDDDECTREKRVGSREQGNEEKGRGGLVFLSFLCVSILLFC